MPDPAFTHGLADMHQLGMKSERIGALEGTQNATREAQEEVTVNAHRTTDIEQ